MKVKITGHSHSSTWYKVGEIHEISQADISEACHACANGRWIYKKDCEVFTEPRLYKHEGKTYVLPEWAKYVTCDGPNALLIGWAKEPKNESESTTRANFQEITYAKRKSLVEYVKPLPEGAFIVEV